MPGISEKSRGTKTANIPSPYRRAGACPPPCPGESKNREEQKPPTYRHYTVGRGPVPRHASDNRTLFMTHDREGQALALRKRGSDSIETTIARDRPSRYGMRGRFARPTIARDRPSRYGNGGDSIETTIARDRPSRYGPRGVIYDFSLDISYQNMVSYHHEKCTRCTRRRETKR